MQEPLDQGMIAAFNITRTCILRRNESETLFYTEYTKCQECN